MIRSLFRLTLPFCFLLHLTWPAAGQPWSEKLGYPPGAKVVILNVRELGLTWETNEAGKALLESGKVTSASLVVTGPWFEDMAAWSRQNADKDLGISIALTNPYHAVHWRLLTSDQGHTSLVNANGFPWKTIVQFGVNATAEDVKLELDAQVSRAREAGVRLSHLNGYYGTAFIRTDLAAVLLGAAKKYWLPAPVVELTPELVQRFRSMGFPVDLELIQLLDAYPLPKLDDLRLVQPAASFEEKRDLFCESLKSLQPGLTQIDFRPAVESRGLQILTPDWQQRVWDRALLDDPKVHLTMVEERILVTNWREIMRRFEGEPVPTLPTEERPQDAE